MDNPDVVILGEGGHARVLRALGPGTPMCGPDIPVGDETHVVIGVGDLKTRRALYAKHEAKVFGVIARDHVVIMGEPDYHHTAQIMAGVIIQPGGRIGANVLLNTGCQIDHDCIIGDHCIISPGAILCGSVDLGEGCQIGAGAIIVQGVKLDAETIVPACALVVGPDDIRRPGRVVRDV